MGLTVISIIYSGSGTVHSAIEVVEKGHLRQLRFGRRGGWQGALDLSRPDRPMFPYQRAFQALVHTQSVITSFLALGVGTGTSLCSVSRAHPGAVLHGVEIDQKVLDIAIQFFQAPDSTRAEYWIGDGFAFIQEELPTLYDLVFVDAYMRNDIHQQALLPKALAALEQKTTAKGTVVFNIIANSLSVKPFQEFIKTAKVFFPSVVDWPVGVPLTLQNRLLILSKDESFKSKLSQGIRQKQGISIFERVCWPLRIQKI